MTDVLTTIFTNMSRWRHLPAYQLERRADIFFSAYLPAVIAEHTGVPVVADVIPELPIRRDLIWPGKPSRSSVKVDYAVLAQDRSKVFFVELKTNSASRRDSQDTYLSMAAEVGFKRIVQGIVEITQATTAYQKYGHLLHALADRGCVRLPEGLDEHLWPVVRPGLGKLLRDVERRGAGAGTGAAFSTILTGLARQDVDGLWLTRIELDEAGAHVALEGRALEAEEIPRFLRRLGREPAFEDRRFRQLEILRSDDGAAGLAFRLATTPAPDVLAGRSR